MADNFENLGFSVKIDGADSAVSHLDEIVQRLERIRELNGNVRNVGGGGNRRQTTTVDQPSGGNTTEIKKLSEIEKYKQRVAKQTELVTDAEYAEVRAKEMLNQALKNQISYPCSPVSINTLVSLPKFEHVSSTSFCKASSELVYSRRHPLRTS